MVKRNIERGHQPRPLRPPAQRTRSETDGKPRSRVLSVTKTERHRSANLPRMPTGLVCKLRQCGRDYGGRRPKSRGFDQSLQPPPCGGRWYGENAKTVVFLPISAQKKAKIPLSALRLADLFPCGSGRRVAIARRGCGNQAAALPGRSLGMVRVGGARTGPLTGHCRSSS